MKRDAGVTLKTQAKNKQRNNSRFSIPSNLSTGINTVKLFRCRFKQGTQMLHIRV
jgi:hypothetical protein